MKIDLLNHFDPDVHARLMEYLAPHETHCLFILANLVNKMPGSYVYVAREGNEWAGLGGYYAGTKALIPFSADGKVVRALTLHIAKRHEVLWTMGLSYAAQPAYDTLLELGGEPDNDPRQLFMEYDCGPPPVQPHEADVRHMRDSDRETIARLMRYVRRHPEPEGKLTDEEIHSVGWGGVRYVLETNGTVMSTAFTNGIGIEAFQILGVATMPDQRRHGYARAVCCRLMREMYAAGAKKCVLFTNHDNAAAVRCYEGLGFRVTARYVVGRFRKKA